VSFVFRVGLVVARRRYRQEMLRDIETHRVDLTTLFPDLAAKRTNEAH
jgi:hypothetical protein